MSLDAKIAEFAWRRRLLAVCRWSSTCLLGALAAGIVIAGLDKLVYLGVNVYAVTALLGGLAVLAAAVLCVLREPVSPLRTAADADRRLRLADRLASALELRHAGGPWSEAVLRDAERRLRGTKAAAVFPFAAPTSMRLLVPAAIAFLLLSILPPADLLGRMDREVERRVVAELEARRERDAIAAAAERLPSAAWPELTTPEPRDPLGALRLALTKIEADLRGGKLDDARRLELGDRLRKFADLMADQRPAGRLDESLRRAADALATGDTASLELLRAIQDELARMEKALADAASMDEHMRRLAESKRDALGATGQELAAGREPETAAAQPDDLELAALSKEPPAPNIGSSGIIYSRTTTGDTAATTAQTYESAAHAAAAGIQSGRIPSAYVRLVRDYFNAVKPAPAPPR